MTAPQTPRTASAVSPRFDRRVPGNPSALQLWEPATLELTVVVPFLNPGAALRRCVLAIIDRLFAAGVSFEVIGVSDGSTDGSAETIRDLPYTRVIVNARNRGKGAALRQGFAAASGAWIGFIDADGDIDPRHLVDYLHRIRAGDLAGVYADKWHTSSDSGATRRRKVMSGAYAALVRGLFRLEIRDTQTGCKIFRRDVLQQLLPRLYERRFACDLELFVTAKCAGITNFAPAPVQLECRVNGSTINSRAILHTVGDTFAVFGRHQLPVARRPSEEPPMTRMALAGALDWWRRPTEPCPVVP